MAVRTVLPEGVHALTIKEVTFGHSKKEFPMFTIRMENEDGVNAWWYAVDQPNARWVWQDITPIFGDLPAHVGRTYLFPIEHDTFFGNLMMRVKQPVAEVLP